MCNYLSEICEPDPCTFTAASDRVLEHCVACLNLSRFDEVRVFAATRVSAEQFDERANELL
jgi:hypothetical protein